VGAPFLISTK